MNYLTHIPDDWQAVLATGTNKSTKPGEWKNRTFTLDALIDRLTQHAIGPKDGNCFLQGKASGGVRTARAMEELSKVLTFGAQKYAAHNWRKGLHKSRLLGAALRHLFAYLGGQDKDPETGLSHAAHAMCCCMFILGLEHRTDLDDRPKDVGA